MATSTPNNESSPFSKLPAPGRGLGRGRLSSSSSGPQGLPPLSVELDGLARPQSLPLGSPYTPPSHDAISSFSSVLLEPSGAGDADAATNPLYARSVTLPSTRPLVSSSSGPRSRTMGRRPQQSPLATEDDSELTVTQLKAQLYTEMEWRQTAEDEAWLLERQLLSWQETASTSKIQLSTMQTSRDKLAAENQVLQQCLMQADVDRRELEGQIRDMKNKRDMESARKASSEAEDETSPRTARYNEFQAEQAARLADVTKENDDLINQLCRVKMELAQLHEAQERDHLERVQTDLMNDHLMRKVELLAELVTELRMARTAQNGNQGASSYVTRS